MRSASSGGWEGQKAVIATLCDNLNHRCEHRDVQMLREDRAGALNTTWGRRTLFLKEPTAEMREESAIFFPFLSGKAKQVF